MKTKTLLLLTLMIIAGTFAFLRMRNTDSDMVEAYSHQTEVLPKNENQETVSNSSIPDSNHENDNSNDDLPSPLETNRGLCFYTSKDKRAYIFLEVAKLLNEKRPTHILLPSVHSDCLIKNDYGEFNIINYDPLLDVAYDYLGKISFKLIPEREYRSIEEFSATNENINQNYGLNGPKELSSFLNQFGYGRLLDKKLYSFKVNQITRITPKNSAVKFEIYPGIEFISLRQALERIKAKKASLVDLNSKTTKLNLNIESVDEPFDALNDKKIISPSIVLQIIRQDKIAKIPKDHEIILFGMRGGDSRVFNVSSWFYAKGHSKVSVIKGGAIDHQQEISETPKFIPGLEVINLEEALKNRHNYLVIDTRKDRIKNHYSLENSYAVPAPLPGGTSYTDSFFKNIHAGIYSIPANLSAEKKINISRLKEILGQKSILLVPSNEYDWSAVLLGLYLRTEIKAKIYWAREGMSILSVLEETGLLTNEKIQKYGIQDLTEGMERIEQMSSTDAESKIIMIAPTKKSNNELRLRSQREYR